VTHLISDVQLLNQLKKPKIFFKNLKEVRRNYRDYSHFKYPIAQPVEEAKNNFQNRREVRRNLGKKVKTKEKYYSRSKPYLRYIILEIKYLL
jgi:hypothetical protein